MSNISSFDNAINEMKSISQLNQSGYKFSITSFSINGCSRAEEWEDQIDTIAAILKNAAPSDTLKIYAVKG